MGIEVQGVEAYTMAIFSGEDVYLLGVVTLEGLSLEVDPVRGVLRPMELILMRSSSINGPNIF